MDVRIEINRSLKEQFEHVFKLRKGDDGYYLDPSIGAGGPMLHFIFPGQIELYHFQGATFKSPITMKSVNPADSQWLLIHVNLSNSPQRKAFSGQTISFHKRAPIGLLIYGPGLEIETLIPPDVDSELASVRFSHDFLDTYFEDWRETIDIQKNIIHETLDWKLENKLLKALAAMNDRIRCHSAVLTFIDLVFDKLKSRDREPDNVNLRPDEIANLFRAAALLREPMATSTPSLQELAVSANMGRTKFMSSFRQVFGSAPMQYRNKIRMEYAREEIRSNESTPTEISYRLGYSHPSNFTVAYKKYFGELPSAKPP